MPRRPPGSRSHLDRHAEGADLAGVDLYFSDHFSVRRSTLERYGALDVSLVADLPLFIDPFLLFHSRRPAYRHLHQEIVRYLEFLRNKAVDGSLPQPLIDNWYAFREVGQTWLGFSQMGNRGSGLGRDFATTLHSSLHQLFPNLGQEAITKSTHLEKVCLVKGGVGRDRISDFTTRLILRYLCEYTQTFARRHLALRQRRRVSVQRAYFDYRTETWRPATYTLPAFNGDFVLLTPRDLLTRDDNWINRTDLVRDFRELPAAIENAQLRAAVENYFRKVLGARRRRPPKQPEINAAALATIQQFPVLIDYYIRRKENAGDKARAISQEKVAYSAQVFLEQLGAFAQQLARDTGFYRLSGSTYEEALERLRFLKEEIEDRGGWRIFYYKRKPIERESDVQVLYQLVWYGTSSDLNREVNNGRGPVDFKVSRGARDKSLVEFKLASNSKLEQNLRSQVGIYERASRTKKSIKAIVYFSQAEVERVQRILRRLKLTGREDVVLIDARSDNKTSASRA